MDLDRVIGGAYAVEDGKQAKAGRVLGGMKRKKMLGKTQDMEMKPEGGRVLGGMTQKKMLGRTQKKMLGKTQDMEGGRILGGLLGGMKEDKMAMLREMAEKDDKELEGNGFYASIGRGLMKKLRPHLTGGMLGGMLGGVKETAKQMMESPAPPTPAPTKEKKSKRVMTDKMKKRGELVRQLMKEKGMTLGQASKHIKENQLL